MSGLLGVRALSSRRHPPDPAPAKNTTRPGRAGAPMEPLGSPGAVVSPGEHRSGSSTSVRAVVGVAGSTPAGSTAQEDAADGRRAGEGPAFTEPRGPSPFHGMIMVGGKGVAGAKPAGSTEAPGGYLRQRDRLPVQAGPAEGTCVNGAAPLAAEDQWKTGRKAATAAGQDGNPRPALPSSAESAHAGASPIFPGMVLGMHRGARDDESVDESVDGANGLPRLPGRRGSATRGEA